MIRDVSRVVLAGVVREVARLPFSRRALHAAGVLARGPSIAFLRCRRLVPDTSHGQAHPDRARGAALFPRELSAALEQAQATLRFVHPGEALRALRSGRRQKEPWAVLTFDEGLAATAELALPVLQAKGIPALFFVSTGCLDGSRTLWDLEVQSAVYHAAPSPLRLPWVDQVLRTDSVGARARSTRRLLMMLSTLDELRLHRRLVDLFRRTDGMPPLHPLDRPLTAPEITRLARHPLISVGAHGHHHVPMAQVSDETLEGELVRPRTLLREMCDRGYIDVVSYPFGRTPWVTDRVREMARAVGYQAGFGAEAGVARPGDHLFALPRLPIGHTARAVDAWELHGLSEAVDDLLLLATGAENRHLAELEG